MKVPFAEIPKTGSRYVIADDAWMAETGLRRTAPVQAELTLRRKGLRMVEVRGVLRTGVQLACDRCLTEYDFAVAADFHLLLETEDEEDGFRAGDMEVSGGDLDIVQVDEPAVDLLDILRQQLHLSLPVRQTCSQDCKGLCPSCGVDLNAGDCACMSKTAASPFAVLAALKKK